MVIEVGAGAVTDDFLCLPRLPSANILQLSSWSIGPLLSLKDLAKNCGIQSEHIEKGREHLSVGGTFQNYSPFYTVNQCESSKQGYLINLRLVTPSVSVRITLNQTQAKSSCNQRKNLSVSVGAP